MTEVKLNNVGDIAAPATKSAEIISQANKIITITDELGKKITLKRPGVYEFEVGVHSLVEEKDPSPYVMANIIKYLYVSSIDGVPVSVKTNLELRAVMSQLGFEGSRAIVKGIEANFVEAQWGSKEEAEEGIKK